MFEQHQSSSRVAIDERLWPLVRIAWPSGPISDLDVALAMERVRAIAARDQSHVVLLVAPDARPPSRAQLGKIIDCARSVGPTSRCLAVAIVTRSSLVRATVDSVRWMALMASRWETFAEERAATQWLEMRLARGHDASGSHVIERPASRDRPASNPPPGHT